MTKGYTDAPEEAGSFRSAPRGGRAPLGRAVMVCYFGEKISVRLKDPERQFPKIPGPQRRSVTPTGADPKHPALFRCIRITFDLDASRAQCECRDTNSRRAKCSE